MYSDFELFCSKLQEYDININEEQFRKFDKYADFLVEYNNNVNLTAITDPLEILVKHFIDSVIVMKYVEIPFKSTIIDVGTGAGFPSVPIKIMRDDIELTLLDSLDKRITFLNELSDKIELSFTTIHGRAEDIAKTPEYREKFDFATARAVANLSTLSEYCIPFVKENGIFISLKGPSENISYANNAISILGGRLENIYDYEIGHDTRRLITIKKISQTPSKYPRNSAQIKKKPL